MNTKDSRQRRGKRQVLQDPALYQQTYLPDVPLAQLCAMTLGKAQADTRQEKQQVCQRIIRESNTRIATAPYLKPKRETTPLDEGEFWLR